MFGEIPTLARKRSDIVHALLRGDGVDDVGLPTDSFSLLEHGLQTARRLAGETPEDIELQIAGLLHDIGRYVPPGHADIHAELGAEFVRPVLGDRIAEIIGLHVEAKRYLVSTESGYRGTLHVKAENSLRDQGGPMTAAEAVEFLRSETARAAVQLRRADDAGKEDHTGTADLDHWLRLVLMVNLS